MVIENSYCLNSFDKFSSGFSSQFSVNAQSDDPNIGNSVTLVSQTRSIPCDVVSSNSKQIMCYTRQEITQFTVCFHIGLYVLLSKYRTVYATQKSLYVQYCMFLGSGRLAYTIPKDRVFFSLFILNGQ